MLPVIAWECEPPAHISPRKVEIHHVRITERIVDVPVDCRGTYREMSSPIMEGISADVPISPHEHAQGRFVEQSVNVVVPPIMEGISAVEQTTPREHVQGRTVRQNVCVVVPPIMEEISADEQLTPHEHVQGRTVGKTCVSSCLRLWRESRQLSRKLGGASVSRSLHMNTFKDGSWNRVCTSSCLRLWRESRQLCGSLHRNWSGKP